MSNTPSGTPDPEDPQSIDAAFHRIVAGYEHDANEPAANVEDEPVDDESGNDPHLRGTSPGDDWSEWDDVRPQPAPGDVEPTEEDEGHYVPPDPAPLPQPDPKVRWAWAAAIGAPVLAILLPLLGWSLNGMTGFGLVVIFLGGFGYLISQMRTGPRTDDGDDGAVV